jgi:hypothetical protein
LEQFSGGGEEDLSRRFSTPYQPGKEENPVNNKRFYIMNSGFLLLTVPRNERYSYRN